jgi:hypothetical protein
MARIDNERGEGMKKRIRLAAMHRREFDKWGAVVKAAGVKPE